MHIVPDSCLRYQKLPVSVHSSFQRSNATMYCFLSKTNGSRTNHLVWGNTRNICVGIKFVGCQCSHVLPLRRSCRCLFVKIFRKNIVEN